LTRQRFSDEAEVAILVTDKYQRSGIGSKLLRQLIDIARTEGIKRVVANVLPENAGMRALGKHFGFVVEPSNVGDDHLIEVLTL
jgi:acetyltransferase